MFVSKRSDKKAWKVFRFEYQERNKPNGTKLVEEPSPLDDLQPLSPDLIIVSILSDKRGRI